MPYLPQITSVPQTKDVTDTFYGYNHRLKINAGEFYNTENLSTRDFPMLSTRKRRGMVRKLARPQGLLAKGGKLAWVDNGTLYYDGEAVLPGLSDGQKSLVNMGAYICVFPDKVFYNTADGSIKQMDIATSVLTPTAYTPCTLTGEDITIEQVKPQSPTNGQYWYDRENKALKVYSEAQSEWVTVATVYTKITFADTDPDLSEMFSVNDGVTIKGAAYEMLNGSKVLYGVQAHEIVLVGLIDTEAEQQTGDFTIERKAPALDFVCECQNRLWGCHFGYDGEGGQMLNELYCCALGDPTNWRQYMGLSTDSWTASVGSDGPWTGAINFLGYPTFFKEGTIHRITVSSTGGHSIYETPARGVEEGSGRSLAIINEELLYKSRSDVCAYQGGFPTGISAALGDQRFSDAVAGSFGSWYCVSMLDEEKHWNLFCYNMSNNLWMREDDMHVLQMAAAKDSLYALDETGVIWDLLGNDGELETEIHWAAQTGILYYQMPNRKQTARYNVMLTAAKGSKIRAFIRYDSDGVWRFHGEISFSGLNSITFPIRPRRCNHMELRLEGDGDAKIYSIARILEEGSDI